MALPEKSRIKQARAELRWLSNSLRALLALGEELGEAAELEDLIAPRRAALAEIEPRVERLRAECAELEARKSAAQELLAEAEARIEMIRSRL